MLDKYDREINYLRISVTKRCNLRCTYCAPGDICSEEENSALSLHEIGAVVRAGAKIGINKIRLTGGEPLVRRDIVEIVSLIKGIDGGVQLGITSNGILLPPLAAPLARAGLDRINISLDTVDEDRYKQITRNGNLRDAILGVDAAITAGIPVKINMVVMSDTTEKEILDLRNFCTDRSVDVQMIRQYSLTETKQDDIEYDRPPPCGKCNRIRLLSNGVLKPCLHSDIEIKLRSDRLTESLISAIEAKPAQGAVCTRRNMIEIGG